SCECRVETETSFNRNDQKVENVGKGSKHGSSSLVDLPPQPGVRTEEPDGDRKHEQHDLLQSVRSESAQEKAPDETDNRAQQLHDHKGRRVQVPRMAGEH